MTVLSCIFLSRRDRVVRGHGHTVVSFNKTSPNGHLPSPVLDSRHATSHPSHGTMGEGAGGGGGGGGGLGVPELD